MRSSLVRFFLRCHDKKRLVKTIKVLQAKPMQERHTLCVWFYLYSFQISYVLSSVCYIKTSPHVSASAKKNHISPLSLKETRNFHFIRFPHQLPNGPNFSAFSLYFLLPSLSPSLNPFCSHPHQPPVHAHNLIYFTSAGSSMFFHPWDEKNAHF